MVDKKKIRFKIFEVFFVFCVLSIIVASIIYTNTSFFDSFKPSVELDKDYIFDKENKIVFSSYDANQLEIFLEEINLDYSNIENTIPDFELLYLPKNLKLMEPPSRRKKVFLSSILPLIIKSNKLIIEERERICKSISEKELEREVEIITKYGFNENDIHKINFEKNILSKVDIVPVSLALAQAAVESGWGTSRFALEGNALFGQWVWNKNLGIKPKESISENVAVRRFDILFESVKSYMYNLNTHRSYSAMRTKRYRPCENNKTPNGMELANWLENYAETRNDYVKLLRRIIKSNNLRKLDKM